MAWRGGTLVVASLLLLAAPAPRTALASGRLNLYCAYPAAALCQAMANGFARADDVDVSVVQKPTGELLAQVIAEAGNPRGDVWWAGTGDVFLQALDKGVFEAYKSPRLNELHDWARRQAEASGYRVVGVYGAVLVLAYNRELLRERHLPPPKCWADLLRPAYRGEIELSHPGSSGTAYMTLATLVQIFGEDGAFDFLRKLHPSVVSYARSGAGPVEAVARAEVAIGVAVQHGVVNEQRRGFPVAMTVPCEGTGQEVGSMAILHNARNPENARRFYDWALSREAQALPFSVDQYPLPANKYVELPPALREAAAPKLIQYDHARFGEARERHRLLARWRRDVFGAP